jgi:hypothetical protein
MAATTVSETHERATRSPVRLGPARPADRRARAGQLGVAVVLVMLGVLGAYWFSARGDAKVRVAVLARDVKRGETVTPADVTAVGMAVDNRVDAIRFEFVDASVAGRVASADLGAGTVLTATMLTRTTAPPAGKAVVGLSLTPGEYPVDGLSPGAAVAVVHAPKTGPGEVLVARADVFAVSTPSSSGGTDRRFVSVTVDGAAVPAVSAAAAADEVRLAMVP